VSELPGKLNGRQLAREYEHLSPEERFRLVIEAGARDDDRERERLVAAAPMRPFKITDPEYMERIDASHYLAVAVALDLGPRAAQLRMIEVTQGLIGRALTVGVCAATEADERAAMSETVTEAVEEPLVSAFATAREELRSEAAAVYGGFAAVCRRDMRLEPDVVLRAHLGPLIVEQLGIDELDGAKPDKRQLADWRGLFARQWSHRTCAREAGWKV